MAEPGVRPTFTELSEKIGEELQEGEQEVRIHYVQDVPTAASQVNMSYLLALLEPEQALRGGERGEGEALQVHGAGHGVQDKHTYAPSG